MFDRFTERARQVMVIARREAQRLGHDYIGTEHLILGLVQEGNGIAARVLKKLGADAARVRTEVEAIVEKGGILDSGTFIPFTPRMKRVLEYASEEARGFGHEVVDTEHLLLGMTREDRGPGAEVLKNLGVLVDVVEMEVTDILAGESSGIPDGGPRPVDPAEAALEEARALVEAILLKRLRHAEPMVPASTELEVRLANGPKGWGFQLWLGHRHPSGVLRTEMAFWVDRAPTLEEHFATVLDLFVKLVRSDSAPPAP